MARKRKDPTAREIKLQQPDRSAPTDETLLQLAQERGLFDQADRDPRNTKKRTAKPEGSGGEREDDGPGLPPSAERLMEAILWTMSLAMLHFTLDVLVQHQYAVDIKWPSIVGRTFQAFLVFLLLFYPLHPHASSPILVPGLPARFQSPLRQATFFAMSVAAGCYMIYITNRHGYLAVMKRAPTLGCLWVWAVVELNLTLAVASLLCAVVFLKQGGYAIH